MKNMMSQVKNSNKSNRPKFGLTAKRSYRLFIAGLTVLCTVLLTGCKGKNAADAIIGSADKPVWTAPVDYDMTSSVTAIVRIDLSSLYTAEQLAAANYAQAEDDELAAFCGDSCLGVGAYQKDHDAYWLYITAPVSGAEVTLKHYSSALKHIYLAEETYPFRTDDRLGSASTPLLPKWKVAE